MVKDIKSKVKVTLIKSLIGRTASQKATVSGLGLEGFIILWS